MDASDMFVPTSNEDRAKWIEEEEDKLIDDHEVQCGLEL